jgi:ferredoxin
MTIRKIVSVDEERCDGCGLCIPSCSEGALRIVGGKARLVSERFCDGLGAFLAIVHGTPYD